jgi:hypothetical protein
VSMAMRKAWERVGTVLIADQGNICESHVSQNRRPVSFLLVPDLGQSKELSLRGPCLLDREGQGQQGFLFYFVGFEAAGGGAGAGAAFHA